MESGVKSNIKKSEKGVKMMSGNLISVPEEAIINMLKTLLEDVLVNLFWKTLIEYDDSPLTNEKREEIEKAYSQKKLGG